MYTHKHPATRQYLHGTATTRLLQNITSSSVPRWAPPASGPWGPPSGPGLGRGVQRLDVDAGQAEPGEGQLPPAAAARVVLEADVEVEVPGAQEEQRARAHGLLLGLHLEGRHNT